MKDIRVLCVEDSPEDSQLLLWELERGGYNLVRHERVETREDLRKALAREGWDLVIGDFSLPSFDGVEALTLVKEFHPEMPFIMVSGTIGEELAVAAMKAGANDYVMKGNLQRLPMAVARELREKRSREEKENTRKALLLTQFSLDRSTEMMVWLREDGRHLQVNKAACKALGFSKGELMSMHIWDLCNLWTRENFPAEWEKLRNHQTRSAETDLKSKDGREIHVDIAITFVPFDGEECAFVLMRDITDKKKAETALKKSEEQLRQSQRMDTVGRLAGGIAHDFNNILSVVSGYGSLLQMKLARSGIAFKELAEIEKAVMRATALVRQLLTFSRRQVIQPQILDLATVAHESLSMLRMVLGDDILVETSLGSEAILVKADRGQLEQIIMNLVVNARDAMPKGGSLYLEVGSTRLETGHYREGEKAAPGDYATLRIRDTGCGMDEATLTRIFEPFFTTKGEGQGTGLGLSTVYGIVQQAGGNIRVESAPESGSTFSIFLPIVQDTEYEEATSFRAAASPSPAKGESILLVEDDVDLRKMTKDILVLEGYRVLESNTIQDAIGFAKTSDLRIDLLLTDLVMPHMNGKDLSESILSLRPGLKVLFMSGYAPEALMPRGAWSPDSNFLEKPFSPARLLGKIRAALDAREADKQL